MPARVCIVGVGFVGQHLATVMATKHVVIGYDVSPARVAHLERDWAGVPGLTATADPTDAAGCDLYCICVPTPIVDSGRGAASIDLSYLEAAVGLVVDLAKPGAAAVVESSVAVGTTRRLLTPLRERGMFVGFSPERVDPGRIDPPAHAVPKVLAALDGPSVARISPFYEAVFDRVVTVSTLESAEMGKLFENCFRLINIAYVNEVADACAAHGIDPHEMVAACATKPFGFMPFTPGLGAGGPCIPVNPHYLLVNNELPLLAAAMRANAGRPRNRAQAILHHHPAASRILVSGIGFKPGQALTTHSPGLDLAHTLSRLGKHVTVHDPLACAGKERVEGLKVLAPEAWQAGRLAAAFDLVCVAMPQAGVDFGVLSDGSAGVAVEWECAPVRSGLAGNAGPLPATQVAEASLDAKRRSASAQLPSRGTAAGGDEKMRAEGCPVKVQVSAVL
jgi:nucleotide sugar dehydrogenase